jgi:protein-arginine kinase
MTIKRNIKGFPLIPGMSKDQKIEVMKIVERCFEEFEDELRGVFYELDGITETDKKALHNIMIHPPADLTFEQLSG